MKKLIFITAILLAATACNESGNKKTESKAPAVQSKNAQAISAEIEKNPTNPELYYRRANAYFDEQYLDRALADVEEALVLAENNPLYLFLKGRILYAMNRTMDAAKVYERAIAIKPDFEDARLKLAELYLVVKEHKKSVDLLNVMLANNKSNTNALFVKGMNLKEMGDTAGAIQAFQKAYEVDASFYDAVMQLGILYAALENKIALDYYVAAARINPKSAEPPYNAGVYLQQKGEFKKAIFMYKQALKADPQFYLAYFNAGIIAARNCSFKEAIGHFNQVVRLEGGYIEAYYMRGVCYEELKNYEDARLNYEQVLEMDPNHKMAKAGLSALRGK